MSSKRSAKQEKKAQAVRIVAIVACCALLLTAILPYLAGLR